MNNNLINELLNNTPETRILLTTSLKVFIKVFHYYLKKENFIFKEFHNIIINKLENLVFNVNNKEEDKKNEKEENKKENKKEQTNIKHNLAITLPPRTGKSQLIKYFISWCYAINKNSNFIYTSYSDILITGFSSEVKDIIESELYNKLFRLELKKDTQSKGLWKINNGGQLRASPMGGSITGFGADYILIDDPLKANSYKSSIERNNCIDYYINTLKTRLDNQTKGSIILIMQRLHREDLIGWLQINEPNLWDFVNIPAIDIKTNESIFPERLPLTSLENLKRIDPYTFQAQYMQEPITIGGNIIKSSWFKTYDNSSIDSNNNLALPKFKQVYITIDTALKTGQQNDYSVLTLWGKTEYTRESDYYLLDLLRGKWEVNELLDKVLNFYAKAKSKYNNCNCIYIEDKVNGITLIQQLKSQRINVKPITPIKDKFTRLADVLPTIANGYVYLPKISNWKNDFLAECEAFSQDNSHVHDDQVDCLTMALSNEINGFIDFKSLL